MRLNKFFYMAGMLLLAACASETAREQHAGGMLPADAVPVTLSYQMVPAAQTRAAALTTLNQDYIESGKSVAVLIRNHGVGDYTSYTYTTGSDGALNDPDPVPYYPTDGSTHIDILGYYPASAGSSFTVQTDQTTSAAYMASDLMWATPLVDRALTTDRQTLTFSHLLSKLIVHATAGSGISKIIGVALLQVKPRVSFNNTNGSIGAAQNDATTNNPVNIQMVSQNNTASVFGACVIPPQTITGHLLQITASDASGHNGVATYRVPSGKTFAAGNFYQLDLTVSARDLGATTAITAWASTSSATVSAGSGTLTIADIPAQTYTGSALTPGVTVSYQGTALTASQYDVQYGSNINAGTAYVGVSGKGQYAGVQGFKSFIINKANSSMSNGSGAVSFTSSQDANSQISRTITCSGCSVSGVSVASGSGFSVSRSGNTITVTRTSTNAFSGTITVTGSGDSNHNAPSSISISVSGVAAINANGHAYVDLGNPSCYYATMNVGASSEGERGSFFAWGETTTKSSYDSSNYTASSISTDLSISQDAARAQWGGAWRMPTKAELQWLIDNCTWTWAWTTSGGKDGHRVTSNISGYTSNSIFLPATGYYDGSYVELRSDGYYWSSTYDNSSYAWHLYFNSSIMSMGRYARRYNGMSVRAVLSK